MKLAGVLMLLALAGACLQTGEAAAPQTINYQGVLTDPDGVPIGGIHELSFNLYATEDGALVLWTEVDSVEVVHGVFNAILGDQEPFSLAFDQTYWLGTSVDGAAELEPRCQLTASPYALRATVADSVVPGGVPNDGDWIVDGNDMYAGVSGSVGIGTTEPTAKLEIRIPDGGGGGIRIADSESHVATLGDASSTWENGVLSLYDNGTERVKLFAITSYPSFIDAGNVGIGTTEPTQKLDVDGTVKMTGFQMLTGAGSGKVLTSNGSGVGTWQAVSGTGDITAVYADNGLTGGATSGDAHLDVGAGTGIEVTANAVGLTSSYSSGSAYDGRFVNEGQAGSVSTGMIVNDAVTMDKLAHNIDATGIGFNADKVDGTHVLVKDIFTGSSNDYFVNNSWVKIYGYGTAYNLKIENPSGSGTIIRYLYSLDFGAPTMNTLDPGYSTTFSYSGYSSIEIRIMRHGAASDYQVTLHGMNGYNGWVHAHVIYND